MKKGFIFLIAGTIMLMGCTSSEKFAKLSSGILNCPIDQIEIDSEPIISFWGTQSWEAICKGKRYICSDQSETGVSCTEMINPFAH